MSTDNVTPIRDLAQTAYNVITSMPEDITGLPADEMLTGYRLAPETRTELVRMVSLLQESRQLLTQALGRETPRFEAYSDQLEAREL